MINGFDFPYRVEYDQIKSSAYSVTFTCRCGVEQTITGDVLKLVCRCGREYIAHVYVDWGGEDFKPDRSPAPESRTDVHEHWRTGTWPDRVKQETR